MAAEGIRIQGAPTESETTRLTGYEEKKKDIEIKKQIEKEKAKKEALEGVDEETKPAAKNTGAAAAAGVQKPSEKEGAEESKTGDKRERDETTAPAENGTTNEAGDPASKKQKTEGPSKTEEPAKAENGTAGAATNGEKKKPGRPKKGVKDLAKKISQRATEGIGSRTRSRTKAA
ncbi:hypothetical protein VTN00DRAFT_2118 [Thermoascus crustaceus]|uniref:uncharacterized protein n=1 Tax=Thermoascus crustaceus TaxID=5088 RepID=UPI003742E3CC